MLEQPAVRVRYAPSPTGYPHIGNIRTALFNWLFARHSGGKFIVRIEDTDRARTVEGAVDVILQSLEWLGIDWDEGPRIGGRYGPYFQSERLGRYQRAAETLVEQGDAYYCFCSPEKLDEMRLAQAKRKEPPGYDRRCRNLGEDEKDALAGECPKAVIRFKSPLEGSTSFEDKIRGTVSFENRTIDDFIILKTDGFPTYHLASVVDDSQMKISHVMRAEEWISSTPKHLLLYRALGLQAPVFAHLPMILGPDRSKLSKRHGAVSITQYRQDGYLPSAMVNFLALLGWSLDDRTDIISVSTLIENFSLDRVGKTAAVFNKEKLDWMNGVYIRSLSLEEFTRVSLPFLERDLGPDVPRPLDPEYAGRVLSLVQERAKTLSELAGLTWFFFSDNLDYDPSLLIQKKMDRPTTLKALDESLSRLNALESFDHDALEASLRPLAGQMGLKAGQLFGTLRVAVTGSMVSPPLFETMSVLGRKKCLERIGAAATKLAGRIAG